jgi:hypothetical protein
MKKLKHCSHETTKFKKKIINILFIYIHTQIVIDIWHMRYAFSFEGHNYTQGALLFVFWVQTYAMWNAFFSITQIH